MIWCRNLLTAGSVLSFLSGLLYFFFFSRDEKLNRRLLKLAGTVIFSIILMEINAVIISETQRFPQGILPKTMQAFSLDADYDTAGLSEKTRFFLSDYPGWSTEDGMPL